MKRTRHLWIGFAACLAVVLAAMGWVSWTAWQADRAEAQARRQAALDEKVRLALWRIDSALAPLIAQESSRPYFVYNAMITVDRAYGRMFNRRNGNEWLAPSPLLAEKSPHVLVYFQLGPDEQLHSPQVPLGDNYKLAVPRYVTPQAVTESRENLDRLAKLLTRERLLKLLPESTAPPVEIVLSPLNPNTAEQKLAQGAYRQELQQRGQAQLDYGLRNAAVQQSANTMVQQRNEFLNNGDVLAATDVRGVSMTPLWCDGELILGRRVAVGGSEYVQGCLLDWPGLKASLLETIGDLLPAADLIPVAGRPTEQAGMLAALPVRLVAGAESGDGDGTLSPLLLSLTIAWTCVLLAALAVAGLLAGVVRLSERRAAFVTAVTHELRTPLTTFQMYAEMLAEGMVPDARQQQTYLNTLRAEAGRLTHLVENVLAYARLERGRRDGRVESIALDELIAPMRDRLARRAEAAGLQLTVETGDEACGVLVRANASAVEQILFNLVDNACKYAAGGEDRRVALTVCRGAAAAELRVCDHGPGIAADMRRRLFRSFSKSAQEAARSAPGVGLGLALSRRLARDMGGDLRFEQPAAAGACFVLTLPLAD